MKFLNSTIPGYLLGKYQLIGTVTFTVLFALVFLLIYIPFSETAWFELGASVLFERTIAYGCTAIVFLSCSRRIMYLSKRLFAMKVWGYILWCIAEIAIICAMYSWATINLVGNTENGWWEIFGHSLLYGTISLGVPYVISGMYFAIIDKNNTIKVMNYENVVTDEAPKPSTQTQRITLFDNSGSLKLSVSPDNLLYIESDDNYIKVWYTDVKGELKQYMLRCRLKTVEESFKDCGLVRCNRKYIVNIKKVATLRKEGDTYYLDLACEEIQPLPITKTYTDRILAHFMEERPLMEVIDE